MIILYGLGNNEERYLNTKHNIGRIVLEKIANEKNLDFKSKNKCFETSFLFNGEEVKMIYSNDFMNTSGINVKECLRYLNFKQTDTLLIVQDDSDQIEGHLKLVKESGTAGHRGISSVYQEVAYLKSKILRLKIGIRPSLNKLKSETFVLSKISNVDQKTCNKLSEVLICEFLKFIQSQRIDQATTLINSIKIN